ncbi:MAG: pirin family protein [Proteobacteria bacterium]|nr:pirin family protein [Pseudomonadota bacterium]
MINLRKSKDRGHANHGWLDTYYSFSFADYYDPKHIRFKSLRVINEDKVSPGMGFGTHPHSDMEILTYVISGSLAHKDSMGNGRVIKAGELQAMTAGTGIQHSEFNPSDSEEVHLLQIWIMPKVKGLTPSYAEWKPRPDRDDKILTMLASPNGENESVLINQDAYLYLGKGKENSSYNFPLPHYRNVWLQMIEGELECNNTIATSGDGLSLQNEDKLELIFKKESKFLLFELD